MVLSEAEKAFIHRRRRLARSWPYVGAGILALIASFVVWLVLTKPLLVNPFLVLSELRSGALQQATVTLMAGLLPVAVSAALMVCIAIVILAYAAFSNERKYLAILERCGGG